MAADPWHVGGGAVWLSGHGRWFRASLELWGLGLQGCLALLGFWELGLFYDLRAEGLWAFWPVFRVGCLEGCGQGCALVFREKE